MKREITVHFRDDFDPVTVEIDTATKGSIAIGDRMLLVDKGGHGAEFFFPHDTVLYVENRPIVEVPEPEEPAK